VVCILVAYLFSQSRYLEYLGLARTSVGYCHVDEGCKISMDGLPGSNGIARAQNGTVYVANSKSGAIHVLEEQNDHSLVLVDTIALGAFAGILRCNVLFLNPFLDTADRPLDNLSIDTNEALWAAGIPDGLAFISAYYNLEKVAPSSAIRITKNAGNEAFFGEKLKVEKVRRCTLLVGVSRGSVTYFFENRYLKMTESRLLERRLLFTMLGAISSSCRVSLMP
jgi:arylesterase/paraoxonase